MNYKIKMLQTKDKLRKELKKKLTTLTSKDRNLNSIKINTNLNLLLTKLNIQTLCVFIPTSNEPDLNIDELLKKHDSVYCPKFIKSSYNYSKIKHISELTMGKYNILEPRQSMPLSDDYLKSKNIIFLVPLVGFDNQGNRIGYGNGYYDRLLANVTGPKIGICFSFQETPAIITDPHDKNLDYIITENKIISSTKSSPKQ